jgi:SAM-dependent methyltransferase
MVTYASKYRSEETEIMDDFHLQGNEMQLYLTDLNLVNKWLGGFRLTLDGISELMEGRDSTMPVTIIDLGCGDGEMLRKIARFAEGKGYRFNLIGLDANAHILAEAETRSAQFPNISFQKMDVFSEELHAIPFDIALCSLFLHHFSNNDIVSLLQRLSERANIGIVVNDLHRSRVAFGLFRLISNMFLTTPLTRRDGLVSIARGFKKKELVYLSESIRGMNSYIRWNWAFRYKWILKKHK